MPAARKNSRLRFGYTVLLLCSAMLTCLNGTGWSQPPATPTAPPPLADVDVATLFQWEGLPVKSIHFEGVAEELLKPLTDHLAQAIGKPLDRSTLRRSLHQLFDTGMYETIEVAGSRQQDGVALVFRGTPRLFIGTFSVYGAKGPGINTKVQRASRLMAGTRYTTTRLDQALEQMYTALANDGFHQATIKQTLTPHPQDQLVDMVFEVTSGPQARVGSVQLTGDSGISAEEFSRYGHLRPGSRVDHDTANRAMAGVLKHYQRMSRLEAEIKLTSQQYNKNTNTVDFQFSANRGPVVEVKVTGTNLNQGQIKRLIPIYEEGSVDEDLLNEGGRRIRDYYQRLGYFDTNVDHNQQSAGNQVTIEYTIAAGQRRKVQKVTVAGNKYFDSSTLQKLLSVHSADSFDRHGVYNQALVTADINTLESLYRNNGFASVKVTAKTNHAPAVNDPTASTASHEADIAPFTVVYQINEGTQQQVGSVQLKGNLHVDSKDLLPLLNTTPGQLLSPANLAGDRDTLMSDYLNRGFDQARLEINLQPDVSDTTKTDVTFNITEGQQLFVRRVLLSGLEFTRPSTVARAITLHPGDPLSQTALSETQRNLYNFALFNEVNTAIQNPTGGDPYKTILLQATEARRWVITYGFGFEAQTGTPQNNCAGYIAKGVACNPNGKTGVSPRGLLDVTRNNLFGREQSASLQATYGLLEQRVDLLYQNPHFRGHRDFGFTFTGGYANSKDVATYVASRLQGGVRWTENFTTPHARLSRANTFIYEFDFRRVKVAENSLQVYPNEINTLATAARVSGPGFTWIRDTRDSPLDARSGTYTSFQEFLSTQPFFVDASFNRLDISNSSYYSFGKERFVLARNTRYGQERAFGSKEHLMIPLPERLYAGGATSLRGFPVNAAGPRDPETGYPIGGAGALINSVELRLPPPTLPWLGNTVSFVLFHDMGNIFTNAGDAWISALRIHQPHRELCRNAVIDANGDPVGPDTSTGKQGLCSFNYFAHSPGLGIRYHTPVGPIRFDFSYNLNAPIYPIAVDYAHPTWSPHIGEANHFNFFFSLGQTF